MGKTKSDNESNDPDQVIESQPVEFAEPELIERAETELHKILAAIEAEAERFLGTRAVKIKRLVAEARSHL